MKYTLPELTQDVLSSLDSDEINSIGDTSESQQVVKVLKAVYDDIISRSDLVSNKTLFTLDASADVDKPVMMTKPETIDKIEYLRYNKVLDGDTDPVWTDLKYLPVRAFLEHVQQFSPSESDVDTFEHTVNGFNFTFHYRNDVGPCYYTSIDDTTLVFDAYDSDVDDTLQSSKTIGYGSLRTEWTEEDTFTPNLQPEQFALLLNEAKSLAWAELKQTPHLKAETTARRNWRHLQRTRQQTPSGQFGSGAHPFDQLSNFGRK
jgi:hypothetical protein